MYNCYHLLPLRDNQCRSHRSVAACGIAVHVVVYNLSFDSVENATAVESCTAGKTGHEEVIFRGFWKPLIHY